MPTARPNSFILQLVHPCSPLLSERNTGFYLQTRTAQVSSPSLYTLKAGQTPLQSFASNQFAPPVCQQTMPANDCHRIY